MIDQGDIDRKDFSVCLPDIIARLSFVACALNEGGDALIEDPQHLLGMGSIINQAVNELNTVNETFYPTQHKGGGS